MTSEDLSAPAPPSAHGPRTEPAWLSEAEHRAQAVLSQAERSLDRDLSRPAAGLGATMVFTGCLCMVAGLPFAFSLTTMVWGSIIAVVAVVIRYKATRSRVDALRIAGSIIRDVAHQRLRWWALSEVFSDGPPKAWSAAEVTLLLERAGASPRSTSER